MCVCVCVCVRVCVCVGPTSVQLFVTHGLEPTRLLCPWNIPEENTGVSCHFLLQGLFPTQGLNPPLLHLPHWQVDSLPLCHLGGPGRHCCVVTVHADCDVPIYFLYTAYNWFIAYSWVKVLCGLGIIHYHMCWRCFQSYYSSFDSIANILSLKTLKIFTVIEPQLFSIYLCYHG